MSVRANPEGIEESTMNPVIRELQTSDLSRCLSDTLSSLADVGLTAEQMQELMRERLRAGMRTFVAWDPSINEVVGSVSLLVERKFIHRGGKVGHIEDV